MLVGCAGVEPRINLAALSLDLGLFAEAEELLVAVRGVSNPLAIQLHLIALALQDRIQ